VTNPVSIASSHIRVRIAMHTNAAIDVPVISCHGKYPQITNEDSFKDPPIQASTNSPHMTAHCNLLLQCAMATLIATRDRRIILHLT
jgi:hypothetical protein